MWCQGEVVAVRTKNRVHIEWDASTLHDGDEATSMLLEVGGIVYSSLYATVLVFAYIQVLTYIRYQLQVK